MSALSVSPPFLELATSEVLPIAFDATALLANGDAVATPTAILTRVADGTDFADALSDSPAATDNVITVTVDGSELVAGESYRLAVSFSAGGVKVETMELELRCVF